MPSESRGPEWGEEGSRIRGLCHWYDPLKGYGFIRYLRFFTGPLWVTDTKRQDSPYASTFVHSSELQRAGVNTAELPSRQVILEFTLLPSPTKPGDLTAQEVTVVPRPAVREPRAAPLGVRSTAAPVGVRPTAAPVGVRPSAAPEPVSNRTG